MKNLSIIARGAAMVFALTAIFQAVQALGQTFTIPAPSCKAVITCQQQTFTIPVVTPVTPPVVIPPVVTPPSGVTWGYFGGTWTWGGDFTGQGTSVDYHHATTTGLHGHTQSILIAPAGSATATWPYWLPYFAADYKLPNPGYTKLLFSIRPTVTGQAFGIHMEKVGDVDPGCHIELAPYGPASVAGVWASYVIPLKDLCTLGDPTLYKFLLQDHSATSTGWEVDEAGLQ